MIKSNIRFLENLLVDAFVDGDSIEMRVNFGRWYIAEKVVDTNDGFFDIYLHERSGGGIIFGIAKNVVELHGIEPVYQEQEQEDNDE
jgi:hypothetical protein